MRYKSGRDFRQALEARLRTESIRTGAPLVRLRKDDLRRPADPPFAGTASAAAS